MQFKVYSMTLLLLSQILEGISPCNPQAENGNVTNFSARAFWEILI